MTYGRPQSIYGQQTTDDRPKSPYAPSHADRPKSPFMQEAQSAINHSSPFDRPKSGIEGSFFGNERPKSAFGDPPAIFGDSGPAADAGLVGAGTSLFGDAPASVFGDTGATGATDGWSFPAATIPTAESPKTIKSAKSKRKSSAAATPTAPASGLASRASPAIGGNKSPFGKSVDVGMFDEPVVAAVASSSPALGGGLWGSKAPSPFEKQDKDKRLSPLNPASHIHDDPPATTTDTWGFENKGAGGGDGWNTGGDGDGFNKGGDGDGWNKGGDGDGWNSVSLGDSHPQETKVPSKVPSRVPSPAPPTPAAEPPSRKNSRTRRPPARRRRRKHQQLPLRRRSHLT
ncbi:hypothetical protein BDZ97DRAFT_1016290 [Flammula alnicola]|nr:hypothetical protein BDZ97DRAFT_1016290 [Flammula alnicola]